MPAPEINGNVKTRAETPPSGAVRHLPPSGAGKKLGRRTGNERLTPGQMKAIWTIIRKCGIEEEMFRDWLQREFKTDSTRNLTQGDAAEVIRSLKVFTGEEYDPHLRGLTWGITRQQSRYIKALASNIGWKDDCGKADEKRIGGMVRKMFPPKNRLELLNKKEATALIIALEKMEKQPTKGSPLNPPEGDLKEEAPV
jgi:hypothetical protein